MRRTSHTQTTEPFLEYFLSYMRFWQAEKYIKDDSIVADLGCGYNGNLLKNISKKIKIGIGYDVSVTKTGLPKNIILKKTNLNKTIDNKKDFFDTIVGLAVLEHVESPKAFLKKVRIMLKKKGKIIITTPHKNGRSVLEFLSFKLGLVSKDEISDHKNYFDEITLKDLIKNSGLKLIKIGTFEFGGNLICVAQKT